MAVAPVLHDNEDSIINNNNNSAYVYYSGSRAGNMTSVNTII
jgi:hypothetical protein